MNEKNDRSVVNSVKYKTEKNPPKTMYQTTRAKVANERTRQGANEPNLLLYSAQKRDFRRPRQFFSIPPNSAE